MASSSGSEVKKLISKAVSGAVTKVLANLQPKKKPEADADSCSDDDFEVTPHAKKRKIKDNISRYALIQVN